MSVLLETNIGNIVIDLEVKKSPRAALNFIKLCKTKSYNCSLIHAIDKDFTAQITHYSGNASVWNQCVPAKKYFCPEVSLKLKHKARGTVSFSTAFQKEGVIFAGSDFFITLSEKPLDSLDQKHAILGHVVEGFDVLDRINNTLVDSKLRPFEDIWIKHTVILDDPFEDPKDLLIPSASPNPTTEFMSSLRIDSKEPIVSDEVDLDKLQRTKDAETRALTLEMIGDLPFAEIDPPDTILFVCKLNFITQDDDLELIFSRFGEITECKVVRDEKGKSKGFAFIEFVEREACEMAYFKMDNVLIDDKRIKVDFSQSVGKMNVEGERGIKEGNARDRNDDYELVFDDRNDRKTSERRRSRSREKVKRSRSRERQRDSRNTESSYDRDRKRYSRSPRRDRR